MPFDEQAVISLMNSFVMPIESYGFDKSNRELASEEAVYNKALELGVLAKSRDGANIRYDDLISKGVLHYNFGEIELAAGCFQDAFTLMPYRLQAVEGMAQVHAKRYEESGSIVEKEAALLFARFAMEISQNPTTGKAVFDKLTNLSVNKKSKAGLSFAVIGGLFFLLMGITSVALVMIAVFQSNTPEAESIVSNLAGSEQGEVVATDTDKNNQKNNLPIQWAGESPVSILVNEAKSTNVNGKELMSIEGLMKNKSDKGLLSLDVFVRFLDADDKVVSEATHSLQLKGSVSLGPNEYRTVLFKSLSKPRSLKRPVRIELEVNRIETFDFEKEGAGWQVVEHNILATPQSGLAMTFENRHEPPKYKMSLFFRKMAIKNTGPNAIDKLKIRLVHQNESGEVVYTSADTNVVYGHQLPLPSDSTFVFMARDRPLEPGHSIRVEVMEAELE